MFGAVCMTTVDIFFGLSSPETQKVTQDGVLFDLKAAYFVIWISVQ